MSTLQSRLRSPLGLQIEAVMLPGKGQSRMPAYSELRGLGDDVYYDINLGSSSMSALLDWHPFNSGFRTTGGLVINSDGGEPGCASRLDPRRVGPPSRRRQQTGERKEGQESPARESVTLVRQFHALHNKVPAAA